MLVEISLNAKTPKIMTLLIHIDCLQRLRFFLRLQEALEKINVGCVLITCRPSIALRGYVLGVRVRLVQMSSKEHRDPPGTFYDAEVGELSLSEASLLYASTFDFVSNLVTSHNIQGCVFWNGAKTADRAIHDVARFYKLKVLFLEIANVPGKIFVDPLGVNAASSIAQNPGILDDFENKSAEYDHWLEGYLRRKKQSVKIPQAKAGFNLGANKAFDWMCGKLLNIPKSENHSVLKLWKREFRASLRRNNFDHFDFDEKYIFFPMQVSSDTQLIMNSELDNDDGIAVASDIAQRKNLKLLVKPHPAEDRPEALSKLEKLRKNVDLLFINENTFLLIDGADLVVTLNSTVGLESMLLGKEVKVLSSAYYKSLNSDQLKALLMSYLINIDYFSSEPISVEAVSEMMGRMAPAQ